MKISPRARRTARLLEVDPALAIPTGANGRIIERDIRTYIQSRPGDGFGGMVSDTGEADAVKAAEQPEKPAAEREYVDVKFSAGRQRRR